MKNSLEECRITSVRKKFLFSLKAVTSLSSEVDTNTALITSKSKYDDVGIIEASQAGSCSAYLTTDLTLPENSLDTSTANVDASCFIIHSGIK